MRNEERGPYLPTGYRLDESDPDVVVLRRPDGTAVGVFSPQGTTREAIEQAAWRDYEERTDRR